MDALSNIPPFYVGEEVEYITGYKMPKWTKVIVTDVWKEPCGCWYLSHNKPIDEEIILPHQKKCKCITCFKCFYIGNRTGQRIGWCSSSFRRIQKYPLISLTKIMEKEEKEVLIPN